MTCHKHQTRLGGHQIRLKGIKSALEGTKLTLNPRGEPGSNPKQTGPRALRFVLLPPLFGGGYEVYLAEADAL